MGWSRRAEAFVNPVFLLIRPIPPLAWIPLAIVWLGLGDAAKVLVIWFAAFVPAVINSYTGVRAIEPALIEAARMLGTPPAALRPRSAGSRRAADDLHRPAAVAAGAAGRRWSRPSWSARCRARARAQCRAAGHLSRHDHRRHGLRRRPRAGRRRACWPDRARAMPWLQVGRADMDRSAHDQPLTWRRDVSAYRSRWASLVFFGALERLSLVAALVPRQFLPTPLEVARALRRAAARALRRRDAAAASRVELRALRVRASCLGGGGRRAARPADGLVPHGSTTIVTPVFDALRFIAPIAWVPFAALWFGTGIGGPMLIIFTGAFPPCLINAYRGARFVEPHASSRRRRCSARAICA